MIRDERRAEAVREILGFTKDECPDDEALELARGSFMLASIDARLAMEELGETMAVQMAKLGRLLRRCTP